MEPSAPKRRKTSPTASVSVGSTTPSDPPPHEAQQQDAQSSPARSPQQPSFASPTHQRQDDIPASEPNRPGDDVDVQDALTAQLEGRSEGDGTVSPPDESGLGSQAMTTETRSMQARSASDVLRSPSRRVGGGTLGAQPARRTPTRPQPRPLPAPGPEEEELIVSPFERRGLYRSPLNTGVLPAVVHEEPELPPTPEQPDPVVSTPPSGIHNTPSKRRRDVHERDAMRLQSSPSKHPLSQEVKGPSAPPQKESRKTRGRRTASPVKIIGATLTLPERSKSKEAPLPKPPSEFATGTHPRRSVRLRGPNWEKEQERDTLLKEVAQLEADLELAKKANNDAAKGLPLADKDAVLNALRRHLVPSGKQTELDTTAEWLDTVMDPIAMLGFNGFSAIHLPSAIPHAGAETEAFPPITSHHPIPMNTSEELHYLQMFTPLAFTSSVATISPSADAEDQTTFQKHTINVRSASPPGLFTARIEMVVNTRQKTVTSLAVPRLDPAAADELAPFFGPILSAQTEYNPVKTRNVNLLSWAMGEWYGIALKRAKFWILLETSIRSKDDLVELVQSKRTKKKRKHRRQDTAGDAENGMVEGLTTISEGDVKAFTTGRLLPHMGRTSMDFEIPYLKMDEVAEMSSLRVKWSVEFDWVGEARSNLSVELGLPGKCQAIDKRKSLVAIPKLFDTLLSGGEEPLAAVKTVVALLAGEPGA